MTEPQRALLLRLQRRHIVFSGQESEEERLTMLQLYALRYVTHRTSRVKTNVMEWHLTRAGQSKAGHEFRSIKWRRRLTFITHLNGLDLLQPRRQPPLGFFHACALRPER